MDTHLLHRWRAVRPVAPYAAALLVADTLPLIRASLLVPAVLLAAGAAVVGSFSAPRRSPWDAVRAMLAVVSAFGFPLFLGGAVLPWGAVAAAAALTIGGWCASADTAARIIVAQAVLAALGIGLSAAAGAFFFPTAWAACAAFALLALTLLLVASAPDRMLAGGIPSLHAGAAVLVLSEAMLVLRALPLHWVVSGAVLACVTLALLEHARASRAALLTLVAGLLAFGITYG